MYVYIYIYIFHPLYAHKYHIKKIVYTLPILTSYAACLLIMYLSRAASRI